MKLVHCPLHHLDVVLYDEDELDLFEDDNRAEVAILTVKGRRELKRYVIGKCDEDCSTVVSMLKDPASRPSVEEKNAEDAEVLAKMKNVLKKEIPNKELKKTVEKLRSLAGIDLRKLAEEPVVIR